MGLKEIDLHITNKCVLHCRHCVFSSGERTLPEMGFDKIAQLINDFARLTKNQGIINMFGGELLIRKDVFDIIDLIKQNGLSVGITTNCHVPEKNIDKLFEKKIDRLTSDLDGGTSEMHDWLRNKSGNFDEVITWLKRSVKNNTFTTVNSVLHQDNLNQVKMILELCQKIGVHGLAFYYFTPTGRGLNMSEKTVSPDKWIKTKEVVLTWIKKNSPTFSVCWEEAYKHESDDRGGLPWRCTKEHEETIFVRCDGEIYSCALLEGAPCSLGNINNNLLEKILMNREMQSFTCNKGCPALAFHKYHDLSEKDPRAISKSIKLGCPYDYHILNDQNSN